MQLKLIGFPKYKEFTLPEGYTITKYNGTDADMDAWVECCRNGLAGPNDTREKFMRSICCRNDVDLYSDVFFIEQLLTFCCIGVINATAISLFNFSSHHLHG